MTVISMDAFARTCTDNVRFFVVTAFVVFFFACHNYLQEYVMNFPGFEVSRVYCKIIGQMQ
jgi:hypothetical protein